MILKMRKQVKKTELTCKNCKFYQMCIEKREICDKFKRAIARGQAPTRKQKELISKHKLIWQNWLITSEDKISLAIINKQSCRRKVLFK